MSPAQLALRNVQLGIGFTNLDEGAGVNQLRGGRQHDRRRRRTGDGNVISGQRQATASMITDSHDNNLIAGGLTSAPTLAGTAAWPTTWYGVSSGRDREHRSAARRRRRDVISGNAQTASYLLRPAPPATWSRAT